MPALKGQPHRWGWRTGTERQGRAQPAGAEVAPSQPGNRQGLILRSVKGIFPPTGLKLRGWPRADSPRKRAVPAREGAGAPSAAPAPLYSQEGLNRAVRLQGLCQLLDAVDVGDDAQIEVELREGAGLGHPAADVPEVPLGELAAPQRQQPHRVLPQALADVPDLRPRQRLPGDLDGPRQHLSPARSAADPGAAPPGRRGRAALRAGAGAAAAAAAAAAGQSRPGPPRPRGRHRAASPAAAEPPRSARRGGGTQGSHRRGLIRTGTPGRTAPQRRAGAGQPRRSPPRSARTCRAAPPSPGRRSEPSSPPGQRLPAGRSRRGGGSGIPHPSSHPGHSKPAGTCPLP